jgi:hypothetical protein
MPGFCRGYAIAGEVKTDISEQMDICFTKRRKGLCKYVQRKDEDDIFPALGK